MLMYLFGIVRVICSMTLFAQPELNPMQAEHTEVFQRAHTHTLARSLAGCRNKVAAKEF